MMSSIPAQSRWRSPHTMTHSVLESPWRNWIICGALTVLTLIVYRTVVGFEFVHLDDLDYVVENAHVHTGITPDNFRWAFTEVHSGNWHSLTWVSLMIDAQITIWLGQDPTVHAAVFHGTNLLLHLANVLLVFAVLNMMTRAPWRCAMVAGLFAVHPIHIESVAWVSERKDVLNTLFAWLSIWAYVRYTRARSVFWYITAAMLFVLGLLAKPMLVTLPCVLLLLDIWPLRRVKLPFMNVQHRPSDSSVATWRRAILEKAPLLAIVAGAIMLTVVAQRHAGAMGGTDEFGLDVRLSNAVVAYAAYLGSLFWPIELAVFYPHPYLVPPRTLSDDTIYGAIALLLIVTVGLVLMAWRLRRTELLVGWLWFAGTMVPVIGIIMVGEHAHADRYAYLPFIGLYIILVWGAADLIHLLFRRRLVGTLVAVSVSAVILISLVARSADQVSHWRSSVALFNHALRVTDYNWKAHDSLACALLDHAWEADGDQRRDLLRLCIVQAQSSVNIYPHYGRPLIVWGCALVELGQPEAALPILERALKTKQAGAGAYRSYGIALAMTGRRARAIHMLNHALRLNPNDEAAKKALARAMGR